MIHGKPRIKYLLRSSSRSTIESTRRGNHSPIKERQQVREGSSAPCPHLVTPAMPPLPPSNRQPPPTSRLPFQTLPAQIDITHGRKTLNTKPPCRRQTSRQQPSSRGDEFPTNQSSPPCRPSVPEGMLGKSGRPTRSPLASSPSTPELLRKAATTDQRKDADERRVQESPPPPSFPPDLRVYDNQQVRHGRSRVARGRASI